MTGRSNHVRKGVVVLYFVAALGLLSCAADQPVPTQGAHILFPRGFAVAVDDLGWMEGRSLAAQDGPWRLGINRRFTVNDYYPLVALGQHVGARIMGLFILGEMDREGLVLNYPSMSPANYGHDIAQYKGDEQLAIMDYVRQNAAHIEFGMHGVSHEFYQDGRRVRAEWYHLEQKRPHPEEVMRDHIHVFKRIMAQYGLSEERGHSFPESFVPGNHAYYWNPRGAYSTGRLLHEAGVKYANFSFRMIRALNPPPENDGGLDNGVLVIDRRNYKCRWYAYGDLPQEDYRNFETDIIETHWTNFLSRNPDEQDEVIQSWARLYQSIQALPDRYIAKNTEQLYAQWLYRKYTAIDQMDDNTVIIDNTAMPDAYYEHDMPGNLVLAMSLDAGTHLRNARLNGAPIPAYFEDEGYGYLYLPPLEQQVYTLEFGTADTMIEDIVYNTGTFNVYAQAMTETGVDLHVKMYGRQTIRYLTRRIPQDVTSDAALQVHEWTHDESGVTVLVEAHDIQGAAGWIYLTF